VPRARLINGASRDLPRPTTSAQLAQQLQLQLQLQLLPPPPLPLPFLAFSHLARVLCLRAPSRVRDLASSPFLPGCDLLPIPPHTHTPPRSRYLPSRRPDVPGRPTAGIRRCLVAAGGRRLRRGSSAPLSPSPSTRGDTDLLGAGNPRSAKKQERERGGREQLMHPTINAY
jgi:hypothetical protein